ncbi:MAG: bifunctional homocysteine S-methyltransferase/methylenetetrahydrofolate reductase [Gemmatimonadetes bacterium RIFCSPLOWO2_12_FULL_68_9]|nr:MAG: bifunctional homocysteine S-methyltransferase/methylenetetrahydrofolate reductase [Gemmatimonadetes bacterium RIFCSPLOWO2_12_FULL_68_9]
MTRSLRDLIEDGRVHVCDGAMGTMLYSKGVFVNVCYDELNLTRPTLVQEVHEAYVRAGAELLETNTFGANPVKLAGYGLADRTEEINRAAGQLAKKAADGRAMVLGAIGPLGIRIEPFGPTSRDEARAYFVRQAAGLVAGGVDGFILETFSDLEELHQALEAARATADLPVFAQMTVSEDGSTAFGTDVETLARALTAWRADVVGLNCSTGPAMMLDAIERMAPVTDRPLSAQPNAGLPRAVGDRSIYLSSPEYMATYARRLIAAGVRFIGGCCGTTPEHIRKIRDVVGDLAPRHPSVVSARGTVTPPPGVSPVPLGERSQWGASLARGEFVTTVELLPPKGWLPAKLIEQGRALKAAKVQAVSILDGPRARSRMGSIPAAIVLLREVGIEPVIHYTCRDRTMLGMLSDLLGGAAAGLRNILIVTGDPPRMGPYESGAVSEVDSIGLTNLVYRLNHGLDPGGNPIGEPTRYVIGVAVNQAATDVERELSRLHWKVDAGAEFAVTQPVFDVDQLAQFLKSAERYRVPVVAGLWPLVSLRNAEFLANEVPGINVPERVLARMRTAQEQGADAALAEGIAIAREVKEAVKGLVQGVQISAPLGRVDVALQVAA